MTSETEALTISPEDKEMAVQTNRRVELLIDEIRANEANLNSVKIRLGVLLKTVRDERHWILLGFKTWTDYVESLQVKIGLGRTSLFGCVGIAEHLLPLVGESAILDIGFAKAGELKRLAKEKGSLSDDIIEKAKDPEVGYDEFRAMTFKEVHGEPPPNGTFHAIKGFYCDDSSWEEIQQAFEAARRTDPVIPNTVPEWAANLEILLRLSREYVSSYPDSLI